MAATAGFMIHITCRLTTKNRDQLRNPTLGNRVWTTFIFFTSYRVDHLVFDKNGPAGTIGLADCMGRLHYTAPCNNGRYKPTVHCNKPRDPVDLL